MEYKLVTIQKIIEQHKIIATQKQYAENKGHYQGVIFNKNGDIVNLFQSCCGAPTLVLNDEFLQKNFNEYKRWKL